MSEFTVAIDNGRDPSDRSIFPVKIKVIDYSERMNIWVEKIVSDLHHLFG